jgi:small subunit ribosomal protein S15
VAESQAKYRQHDKDTGSPEYQVAGMTERINYLTKHLQQNPKDFSTRRGLVALVNKRRRLLNYLAKEDEKRYVEIVNGLGIRHKPPSQFESREDMYSRFPKQKAVRKHLVNKKK